MKVYLLRHALAGDRSAWAGDDRLRPLGPAGNRQATAIAKALMGQGIDRLVSSPALRCLETLQPLAEATGAPLDSDPRLAEGSSATVTWAVLEDRMEARENAVLCTHGDVVADLLLGLRQLGARITDPLIWPKGSMWVVEADGSWSEASYIPPPEV